MIVLLPVAMPTQPIAFTPDFVHHLSLMGLSLTTAGVRAVDAATRFEGPATIGDLDIWGAPASIGAFTYLGAGGVFHNATIGRYCSVSTGLQVGMTRHPTDSLSTSPIAYVGDFLNFESHFADADPDWARAMPLHDYDLRPETTIGNDVWIGTNVYIKDGVRIGDGAVIGAHSVVTRDVEPYAIVGGSPARVIRMRFPDALIERLLRLRWWQYNVLEIGGLDMRRAEACVSALEDAQAAGRLLPYDPPIITLVEERDRYDAVALLARQRA